MSGLSPETQLNFCKLLQAAGIDEICMSDGRRITAPDVLHELSKEVGMIAVDEAIDVSPENEPNNQANQHVSPLIQACIVDDMETVRALLDSGYSVNELTESGETALTCAAAANLTSLVQLLLERGADPDLRDKRAECTPLMEAASAGLTDMVRLLLQHGANPLAQSTTGNTALHYAANAGHLDCVRLLLHATAGVASAPDQQLVVVEMQNENGHTPLMEAASNGFVEVARCLLEHGAGINSHSTEFKESALTLASYKGHVDMVELLLEAGADHEHRTDEMHTALMEAAMEGHTAVAQLLLCHGAQVAIPADSFESPLTLAACGGHTELASLLLGYSADIEEVNDEGYTALMEAAREGHEEMVALLLAAGASVNSETEETRETALTLAACGGFVEVAELLVRCGAELERGGSTPLMEAAQEGHVDLVSRLLALGAQVNAQTTTGDTALHYAAENGHVEVCRVLLDNGASLSHLSEGGRTALMKAARSGNLDCVRLLVERGSPIDQATQHQEHTALSLACSGGHYKVVEYLLLCGADRRFQLRDGSTMVIEAARMGHTAVIRLLLDYPDAPDILQHQQPVSSTNTTASQTAAVPGCRVGQPLLGIPDYPPPPLPPPPPPPQNLPGPAASALLCAASAGVAPAAGVMPEHWTAAAHDDLLAFFQNPTEMLRRYETIAVPLPTSLRSMATAPGGPVVTPPPPSPPRVGPVAPIGGSGCTNSSQGVVPNPGGENDWLAAAASTHEPNEKFMQDLLNEFCGYAKEFFTNESQYPFMADLRRAFANPLYCADGQAATPITAGGPGVVAGDRPPCIDPTNLKVDLNTALPPKNGPTPRRIKGTVSAGGGTGGHNRPGTPPPTPPPPLHHPPPLRNPPSSTNGSGPPPPSSGSIPPGSQQLQRSAPSNSSSSPQSAPVSSGSHNVVNRHQPPSTAPALPPLTAPSPSGHPAPSPLSAAPFSSLQLLPPAITDPHQQLRPPAQPPSLNPSSSLACCCPATTTAAPAPVIDVNACTESTLESALSLACAGGHVDLVRLLLDRGSALEQRDKKSHTPLHTAVYANQLDVVRLLLERGGDIESQVERTKDTALSIACSHGRLELVQELLTRGANKEHRNLSDYTPLSLAASGGYVDVMSLLLRQGAEVNSRTNSKLGISPLMLAAMNGHLPAVQLLLDNGADINAQIETNRNTALTLACFQGRHEVVALLVERRANVEHRAKTGLTPLMEAASGGFVEVGRILLDHGADVNAAPVPASRDTALTIAADKGHFKFVSLLLERGAMIEARNKKGATPLWLACNGGHFEVVQSLVAYKADLNSMDNRKVTCLMAAFRRGHLKVVKFLVKYVTQFPSDADCTRHIKAVLNDKELIKKCQTCKDIIMAAKEKQDCEAAKNAHILLEQLEQEEKEKANREALQAKKRERKRQKRKAKQERDRQEKDQKVPGNQSPTPPSEAGSSLEREVDHRDLSVPRGCSPSLDDVAILPSSNRTTLALALQPIPLPAPPPAAVGPPSATTSSTTGHNLALCPTVTINKSAQLSKKKKSRTKMCSSDTAPSPGLATYPTNPSPVPDALRVMHPPATHTVVCSQTEARSDRPASRSSPESNCEVAPAKLAPSAEVKIKAAPPNQTPTKRSDKPKCKAQQPAKLDRPPENNSEVTFDDWPPIPQEVLSDNDYWTTISGGGSKQKSDDKWKTAPKRKLSIPVAKKDIGKVIGQAGAVVNALRQITGAHIDIEGSKPTETAERTIHIRGQPEAVLKAKDLIDGLVASRLLAKDILARALPVPRHPTTTSAPMVPSLTAAKLATTPIHGVQAAKPGIVVAITSSGTGAVGTAARLRSQPLPICKVAVPPTPVAPSLVSLQQPQRPAMPVRSTATTNNNNCNLSASGSGSGSASIICGLFGNLQKDSLASGPAKSTGQESNFAAVAAAGVLPPMDNRTVKSLSHPPVVLPPTVVPIAAPAINNSSMDRNFPTLSETMSMAKPGEKMINGLIVTVPANQSNYLPNLTAISTSCGPLPLANLSDTDASPQPLSIPSSSSPLHFYPPATANTPPCSKPFARAPGSERSQHHRNITPDLSTHAPSTGGGSLTPKRAPSPPSATASNEPAVFSNEEMTYTNLLPDEQQLIATNSAELDEQWEGISQQPAAAGTPNLPRPTTPEGEGNEGGVDASSLLCSSEPNDLTTQETTPAGSQQQTEPAAPPTWTPNLHPLNPQAPPFNSSSSLAGVQSESPVSGGGVEPVTPPLSSTSAATIPPPLPPTAIPSYEMPAELRQLPRANELNPSASAFQPRESHVINNATSFYSAALTCNALMRQHQHQQQHHQQQQQHHQQQAHQLQQQAARFPYPNPYAGYQAAPYPNQYTPDAMARAVEQILSGTSPLSLPESYDYVGLAAAAAAASAPYHHHQYQHHHHLDAGASGQHPGPVTYPTGATGQPTPPPLPIGAERRRQAMAQAPAAGVGGANSATLMALATMNWMQQQQAVATPTGQHQHQHQPQPVQQAAQAWPGPPCWPGFTGKSLSAPTGCPPAPPPPGPAPEYYHTPTPAGWLQPQPGFEVAGAGGGAASVGGYRSSHGWTTTASPGGPGEPANGMS